MQRLQWAFVVGASAMGACASTPGNVDAGTAGTDPVAVQLPMALGGGSGVTTHSSPTGTSALHGLGATYTPPTNTVDDGSAVYAAPPTSVDLSADAPPPGDQGQTGSCTTWATAHGALGWWANHRGYTGDLRDLSDEIQFGVCHLFPP